MSLARPARWAPSRHDALTGHAADWGDLTHRRLDWVHVVAATTWAGGLFVLVMLVLRAAPRWPPTLLPAVMRRFSTLAAACLALVVLTGAYRAWLELPTVAALWRTGYGRVLAVKVFLALGLVGCGAVTAISCCRDWERGEPPARRRGCFVSGGSRWWVRARRAPGPASRLATWVLREAALALTILWCTAMLVESTPGPSSRATPRTRPRRRTRGG